MLFFILKNYFQFIIIINNHNDKLREIFEE